MKSVIKLCLALLLIIIILLFFTGISTKKLEIIPVETKMQAHITTSFFYPVQYGDKIIPDLQKAVLKTLEYEGRVDYGVELEGFDGYTVIASDFSNDYDSQKKLQDSINESIKKRTYFVHTTHPYSVLIFEFIPVAIIFLLFHLAKVYAWFYVLPKMEKSVKTQKSGEQKQPPAKEFFLTKIYTKLYLLPKTEKSDKLQKNGEQKPQQTQLSAKKQKNCKELND